jgi:hypothetical protein
MFRPIPLLLAAVATLPLFAGERGDARQALDDELAAKVGAQDALAWLTDLDVQACLRNEKSAAVELLDGLRVWKATAAEDVEDRGARRMLERRLRKASPEGRALVWDWLDARDLARQRWLCEDGLPLPRRGLGAPELTDRALSWFAGRIQAAGPLLQGPDRRRERTVERLTSLIPRLLGRFDAMFAGQDAQRDRLEAGLWARWEDDVEPFWLGWPGGDEPAPLEPDEWARGAGGPGSARWFEDGRIATNLYGVAAPNRSGPAPYFDWDFEPGPRYPMDAEGDLEHGVGWMDPGPAGLSDLGGSHQTGEVVGGAFLDPWDQAEVTRIAEGWRRRQRAITAEVRSEERRLRRLDPVLADTAREAERSHRTLRRLRGDQRRLAQSIRGWRANRPWITGALAEQEKAPALAQSARVERRTERAMDAAVVVRDGAIAAGGALPRGVADGSDRALDGAWVDRILEGGVELHASSQPAIVAPTSTEGENASASGVRFEGPLPIPGPWDGDLVAWIGRVHPRLDVLDVQLLLELSHRALGEARPAIEARFRDLLNTRGRLALRGSENRLSDLFRPDVEEGEQPEIVFLLDLPALAGD